ncbi:RlmE family RNA methyltransferase [Undibacterium seohonense]|uniref:Ribosomal RNA large subunit methyltransferase E n=1 Tax=Undibacterium seohonense TaxID=1344950 RepID=A0ABR6WYX4_9BURK|nr:RlmE family RNA methyltransferase [Undibacterium seohonense]MBC3805864.1 RlmE family RNA methyltransferase [Undibacterium seohonense]
MAKNKFNQNWVHDHINDPYVKLAQKEGYRSRAVYKLKEIDETEKLIKSGQIIVDLGATPGSWSQYVRNKLSGKEGGGILGEIYALDLLEMEPIADVNFIQGDFREEDVLSQLEAKLHGKKVDVVLSDMAPNLSGNGTVDGARVEYIIELAVEFAKAHLKPNGALLVKCFHGTSYNTLVTLFKNEFHTVANKKPKASKDKSSEIFLLGKGLKHPS